MAYSRDFIDRCNHCIEECKKCNHRKGCPTLAALHQKGAKGVGILKSKCVGYLNKDKK